MSYLDLIHMRWPDFGVLLQLLDVSNAEIAYANALYLPLLIQLLERLPHLFPLGTACIWAVYQEQIHIAIAARINLFYAVETFLVGLSNASACRENLGADEHLGPREA